jgi:hypothetical protein
MNNLDELVRANHHRFVHPGEPEPEWVRRAASQHQALRELRADLRAERANRPKPVRFGFVRRLATAFGLA